MVNDHGRTTDELGMHRAKVTSSSIASIGYDPESEVLEIEFHGGAVYQYDSVPTEEYEGLMDAGSHGKYFHQHIRRRYADRKIG